MNSTISKLEITTPSDCEIAMKRDFDAPRVLVWNAMTQPEHIQRWWGCDQSRVTRCEVDLRVGGTWRIVMQLDDDNQWEFFGEYRVLDAPHKLIYTQIFALMPQHETLVTLVLEEHDGRTQMTETTLYPSREARDGHLQVGVETGAAQSFDKLEMLLRSDGFLDASISGKVRN